MRKFLSAALLALACAATAPAARGQSGVRVGPDADDAKADAGPAGSPKRGEKAGGDRKDARPAGEKASGGAKKDAAKAQTAATVPPVGTAATNATSDAPAKPGAPPAVPVTNTSAGANASGGDHAPSGNGSAPQPPVSNPGANPLPPPPPLTSVYRIGVGDVLDIRLLNQPDSRQSTLFTVLSGGVIEYPLVRDPVSVAGMTAEEASAQLVAELRHRGVFERPQVRVSVREYASHAVIVSGLVNDPGTKILRREAVPLYVVVAESQPKPEAGRAVVISHATGKTTSVDLLDAAAMNLLVQAGDVVSLVVRPPEFFYVGGEISSPGQKSFHHGMTLTQAVLASGGVTSHAGGRVKVLRQGDDGRLVATEYNLKQIEGGAAPDPALQAGDRIEVLRGRR
ncbi:MAG TPA: polysaccharide biosynthesis/export family protein [Pyrinomonadaceae bacterium]|nr:polysaccharide biosynthesis/export family protein [Pyrinomonadaceae bacterium]